MDAGPTMRYVLSGRVRRHQRTPQAVLSGPRQPVMTNFLTLRFRSFRCKQVRGFLSIFTTQSRRHVAEMLGLFDLCAFHTRVTEMDTSAALLHGGTRLFTGLTRRFCSGYPIRP